MAGTSPFRPGPSKQMDGSAFQKVNCVLASCSDLIRRETVDKVLVTAPVLRVATGDKDGGVTYTQAADAVVNKTGIVLNIRYGLDRNQVRDMAASGRGFCISLDCSATVGTKRATGTYTGGHTVYVNAYSWRTNGSCACELQLEKDHAEYLVQDPGVKAGYRWWSAALLYKAAEKRGGGRMNTLAGADTEGVIRKGGGNGGRIRRKPSTTADDLGPIEAGKEYTVVATENGEAWKRPDGSLGFGWNRIRHAKGDGGFAYIAGERLTK